MTLAEYAAAWSGSHALLMRRLTTLFDEKWALVLTGKHDYNGYAQEQYDCYAEHKKEADRLRREYDGAAS